METIMRKLTLLNLAGVSFLVTALFGAATSFSVAAETNVIKTSELPSTDVIHYPESPLYQKPGAPIRYSYTMPKNIEVGQIISFDLRLSEAFQSGDLQVRSGVRGDVSLLSNSGNNNFSMAGSGAHEMSVTFTANSLGRHYIQFQALSTAGGQGPRMRAFSIPIQVGPKQPPAQHPGLKRSGNGDMVISLKAIEEIK